MEPRKDDVDFLHKSNSSDNEVATQGADFKACTGISAYLVRKSLFFQSSLKGRAQVLENGVARDRLITTRQRSDALKNLIQDPIDGDLKILFFFYLTITLAFNSFYTKPLLYLSTLM
jgi:hypothetical protein